MSVQIRAEVAEMLLHDDQVPPALKAELMKDIFRWDEFGEELENVL